MFKQILSLFKPFEIIVVFVGYFLGLAISHYLGFPPAWGAIWNGLIVLYSILFGFIFIGNYFRIISMTSPSNHTFSSVSEKNIIENRNAAFITLLIGITFFAISLIPFFSLMKNHSFNWMNAAIFSIGIFVLGMLEIFPDQLSELGMREFFNSFLYANLVPVFAFLLQSGSIHRLIFLITFPLFFLFLSLFIVLSLPEAQATSNGSSRSLISKLGSMTVLRLHNVSLLMGFLFFLLGTFFDVPWKLIWPALITIPLGLVQIWQVNQIISGRKPNFRALELTAVLVTVFCSYFLIMGMWLN